MAYTSTAPPNRNPLVEKLIEQMPEGRILNVGSGYGANTRRSDQRLTNLDIDLSVLQGGLTSCPSVAADVLKLPFASGSFVGVLLKDVLEHVPNPIAAMTEVHRVSNRDSKVTIIVPRAIPRKVWDDPTHLRGFSQKALLTMLDRSGWVPLNSVRKIGSLPGAGRFPLILDHLPQFFRIPILGRLLAENWIVSARPQLR